MVSRFTYWFAHWCAFQLTAIKLNSWSPRFLFHDWEKPWLQLVFSHKKVSKWHRKWSRHHVEYVFPNHYDYLGMIIDWECASLTKSDKPLNARQTMDKYYPQLQSKINLLLKKMGL